MVKGRRAEEALLRGFEGRDEDFERSIGNRDDVVGESELGRSKSMEACCKEGARGGFAEGGFS